jgi:post-segregation antitoxin (ccd killing protein)
MNKKNPKDVKGRPLTIRLTEEEKQMAKELREKYNINVSSLIRNTIRMEYEKSTKRT